MKEQFIQTSITSNNYISFKSECSCYTHDLHVSFEKDPELNIISLNMGDKMYIEEQYDCGFLKGLWSRFKIAFKILFTGCHEFDYEFCFKGKEHVDEFMNYLNKAYEEIKNENKM